MANLYESSHCGIDSIKKNGRSSFLFTDRNGQFRFSLIDKNGKSSLSSIERNGLSRFSSIEWEWSIEFLFDQ